MADRIISSDETLEEIRADLKAVGFPADIILVHGAPASSVTYLALYMAFAGVARRMPVIFLDGGNSFDPYLIAKLARKTGFRPEDLLRRIYISRAFTCHQMQALVVDRLEGALQRYSTTVAIVSGLLDTFYDEDVPFGEAYALLKTAAATFIRLGGQGVHILLACPDTHLPIESRQRVFLSLLKKSARKTLRCEHTETENRFILEKPHRKLYSLPKTGKTAPGSPPQFVNHNLRFENSECVPRLSFTPLQHDTGARRGGFETRPYHATNKTDPVLGERLAATARQIHSPASTAEKTRPVILGTVPVATVGQIHSPESIPRNAGLRYAQRAANLSETVTSPSARRIHSPPRPSQLFLEWR
jgi:hypothetical protein